MTTRQYRWAVAARHSHLAVLTVLAALTASAPAEAGQVYDLYPPDLSPILTLQPGDTAILHAGTYNRVYTGGWRGGSAAGGWITIKGADGEARPKILYAGGNNTFEMPGVSYMKFQNLEIQGGSETFRFTGTGHDIILDGIYMHNVSDGCVNASSIVELYNLTVVNCEIASAPGEAFYLGGHEKTYQPQVHDSLIEHNYVHNVHEGVEIKAGCTNVTVRDNVISANTGYPSMTIYGTYKTDNNLRYRIYRNFIYSSSDSGIQCTSDAEIVNNVIVNSQGYGISIRARNLDGKMQNITIANNTLYGAADACLQVSNGDIATNVLIANNAIYQTSASATAFNAAAGVSGVALANNLYYGTVNVGSPGLVMGAAPASVFINPATTLGQMNLYPLAGGSLIGAGANAYAPADDFNGISRPRGAAVEVGAYEVYGANNPGWQLATGFKTLWLYGDTDGSGAVDILDVIDVINAFGASEGAANWDPTADLDGDGLVDVFDVIDVVTHFGEGT